MASPGTDPGDDSPPRKKRRRGRPKGSTARRAADPRAISGSGVGVSDADLPPLPWRKSERVANTFYLAGGHIRFWTGQYLHCRHKRMPATCKEKGCGPVNSWKGALLQPLRSNKTSSSKSKNVPPQEPEVIAQLPMLPYSKSDRKPNTYYRNFRNNSICWWTGHDLYCRHKRKPYTCRDCKGKGRCGHDRMRSQCRVCSPHNFCKHCCCCFYASSFFFFFFSF